MFDFLSPLVNTDGFIRDTHGRVIRWFGSNTDVTDRIVYEKTLREMQVAADSANRAKSEFLANMSHEIRTPLTAILGCAEALYRQVGDSESKDVSRMIRDQGQLLLGILNDVLDLSKIDAGKLEIHREKCELVRVINNIDSLMQSLAKERGLELRVQYRTEVPQQFETAPLRLRQILLNLVSNAIKFTEKGFVDINISCRSVNGQGFVTIEVADTGIGISPDRLKAIFDPFVQETRERKGNLPGTGLGLTICQRLAEMLGGSITVESQLNEGSRFSLTLPVGAVSQLVFQNADELLGAVKMQDSSVEMNLFIPCRVLVAEDTRAIQFMMKRLLESFVGSVAVVENGQMAIEAVQTAIAGRKPFDIILMDMQMPVLNGFDATRQLREMGIETPVIALTAGAMSGDRERCLAIGCNDYLPKPVHRNDLAAVVQKYCSNC